MKIYIKICFINPSQCITIWGFASRLSVSRFGDFFICVACCNLIIFVPIDSLALLHTFVPIDSLHLLLDCFWNYSSFSWSYWTSWYLVISMINCYYWKKLGFNHTRGKKKKSFGESVDSWLISSQPFPVYIWRKKIESQDAFFYLQSSIIKQVCLDYGFLVIEHSVWRNYDYYEGLKYYLFYWWLIDDHWTSLGFVVENRCFFFFSFFFHFCVEVSNSFVWIWVIFIQLPHELVQISLMVDFSLLWIKEVMLLIWYCNLDYVND